MKYILGIDDGGSVTKAALYRVDGTLVEVCSGETVPLQSPGEGFTERDMEALWASNVSAIRQVLARAGVKGHDVAAVSATGHGNGLYLVDAQGRPAYNAIISTDERAERLIETWTKDPSFSQEVLPRTAQSLWAGQPPALLAWLKRNRPDVIEKSRWALLASGFVRMRLTGQPSANLSDASGTSIFNVTTRKYDSTILSYYGIDDLKYMLPPIVDSDESAGTVTREAAIETGLDEGTPVAGGVFDIASSVLSSGLVERNRLGIVTGTWSINEYVSDKPVVDPGLFMTSIYPTPDSWLITEGSPTSAGVFEWVLNSVLEPAVMAVGGPRPTRSELYKVADHMVFAPETVAGAIPPFLPFVFGTSKYPKLRGAISGLTASTDLACLLRAVYEGIVFSHLDHIRRLEQFQVLSGDVVFTGGVTNSPQWTQMFADALQKTLQVVKVKEAGTLGTSMAAASMIGEYASVAEAAKAMAPGHVEFSPDPARAAMYTDRFGQWSEFLKSEVDGHASN